MQGEGLARARGCWRRQVGGAARSRGRRRAAGLKGDGGLVGHRGGPPHTAPDTQWGGAVDRGTQCRRQHPAPAASSSPSPCPGSTASGAATMAAPEQRGARASRAGVSRPGPGGVEHCGAPGQPRRPACPGRWAAAPRPAAARASAPGVIVLHESSAPHSGRIAGDCVLSSASTSARRRSARSPPPDATTRSLRRRKSPRRDRGGLDCCRAAVQPRRVPRCPAFRCSGRRAPAAAAAPRRVVVRHCDGFGLFCCQMSGARRSTAHVFAPPSPRRRASVRVSSSRPSGASARPASTAFGAAESCPGGLADLSCRIMTQLPD